MCFLFPRDASAAVSKRAQHLLAHLLGCFKNEKDLSIWQPKAEKSKKRRKEEHDRGKLSDGDQIDLMIIMTNKCVCLLIPAYFR